MLGRLAFLFLDLMNGRILAWGKSLPGMSGLLEWGKSRNSFNGIKWGQWDMHVCTVLWSYIFYYTYFLNFVFQLFSFPLVRCWRRYPKGRYIYMSYRI